MANENVKEEVMVDTLEVEGGHIEFYATPDAISEAEQNETSEEANESESKKGGNIGYAVAGVAGAGLAIYGAVKLTQKIGGAIGNALEDTKVGEILHIKERRFKKAMKQTEKNAAKLKKKAEKEARMAKLKEEANTKA